jgi:hypothetical protein
LKNIHQPCNQGFESLQLGVSVNAGKNLGWPSLPYLPNFLELALPRTAES